MEVFWLEDTWSVPAMCLDARPRTGNAHWSGVITQTDSCCLSVSLNTGLMQGCFMFNLTEQTICFKVAIHWIERQL